MSYLKAKKEEGISHVAVLKEHPEQDAGDEEREVIGERNIERTKEEQDRMIHEIANQSLQIDSEKMRIVLAAAGVNSIADQNRIIQQVQSRNTGFQQQEMKPSNLAAEALSKLPREAISPETNLPFLAELQDGQFIPRIGTFLAENIKDQSKLSKPIKIVKVPSVIKNAKKKLASGNIDERIQMNNQLSQLSPVEKIDNNVSTQGQDIQKYNPKTQQWFQELDGSTGQF
jgi:hypothetical protein